jgi:hypothetical protein
VPNRSGLSFGQSAMKLFDIAARGRPAVIAPGVWASGGDTPPGVYIAATDDEWVDQVHSAASEDSALAPLRLAWALSNTWENRWPNWARAAFGSGFDQEPHASD